MGRESSGKEGAAAVRVRGVVGWINMGEGSSRGGE